VCCTYGVSERGWSVSHVEDDHCPVWQYGGRVMSPDDLRSAMTLLAVERHSRPALSRPPDMIADATLSFALTETVAQSVYVTDFTRRFSRRSCRGAARSA